LVTGEIFAFDGNGKLTQKFGQVGAGPGQFSSLASLAKSKDGPLYVGEFGRIQILFPVSSTVPIASIIKISTNGLVLHEGETLTIIGQGLASSGSATIDNYEWSSIQGQNTIILTGHTTSTLVIAATELPPGPQQIALRVHAANQWSQPVVRQIYVARRGPTSTATAIPKATPTSTITDTPTPVPSGVTPPPTNTPTETPTATPSPTPTVVCTSTWTMMLYLVGDYDDNYGLITDFIKVRDRLNNMHASCVTIVVQMDGPNSIGHDESLDTLHLIFAPGQQPTPTPIPPFEAAMDDSEQLVEFIEWAQQNAPADHYYLAIADHGQGALGLGWDLTTDYKANNDQPKYDKYLHNIDVGKALSDRRVAPIDILHLDACSMALFDVFYQMRYKVKYIIASQYLAWSFFAYDDYVQQIGINTSALDLAKAIVARYAAHGQDAQVPFTLSAINVDQIDDVERLLDQLAVLLKAWAKLDSSNRNNYLLNLRWKQPTFDSNGDRQNTRDDSYIDLKNWASVISADADHQFNEQIRQVAGQLVAALTINADGSSLIVANAALNQTLPNDGSWINLAHAHGVSLYYPTEHHAVASVNVTLATASSAPTIFTQIFGDYIQNQLFDSTFAFRWDEYLAETLGTPAPNETLATPPAPIPPASLPPTATPTATATPTPIPDDIASQVFVTVTYPQVNNKLMVSATIDNRSAILLHNVVLVLQLRRTGQAEASATNAPCVATDPLQVCINIGDIDPHVSKVGSSAPIDTTTVTLSQGMLYVGDQPLKPVPLLQNYLYLPVIVKK
jgi:hypothetical protein